MAEEQGIYRDEVTTIMQSLMRIEGTLAEMLQYIREDYGEEEEEEEEP